MIILIKLLLNSKLDLIWTVKFVKQLFRIQILKGGKVLICNQVKSRMEACYSELILEIKTVLAAFLGRNDSAAMTICPKPKYQNEFEQKVNLKKQFWIEKISSPPK